MVLTAKPLIFSKQLEMKSMTVKEATCTSQIIRSGRATINHTVRDLLNLREGDFVELTVKKVANPSRQKQGA